MVQREADGRQIANPKRPVHTLLNAKRQQKDACCQLAGTVVEKDGLTAVQQRQEKSAIANTCEASMLHLRQQLAQQRKDANQKRHTLEKYIRDIPEQDFFRNSWDVPE
jgi:chromosome segregation ATPase